jgi:hypothetical protein
MVRLEPGVYVVNQTLLVADVRGECVVGPAQGALDEQLKRGTKREPESPSGDTFGQDGGATAT